jgi:hypothetical protein
MGIKLNTALGGSITLEPTNTANNVTVNLPVIDNGSIVTANASGNVGIGTNSPDYKLSVQGAVEVRSAGALHLRNSINTNFTSLFNNSGAMVFETAFTERVRIDSSGNVGIGEATPATYGKFVVQGASNNSAGIFITNASVYGSQPTNRGTIRIVDNPTASNANGGLEFLTSTFGSGYGWKMSSIDSSGVALTLATRQNSATWTEAMRITPNSDVGIGTTDTGGFKLQVKPVGLGTTAGNTTLGLAIVTATNNQDAFEVLWRRKTSADGWNNADLILRRSVDGTANQSTLRFGSDGGGGTFQFDTVSVERMRIDSSGNIMFAQGIITEPWGASGATPMGVRITGLYGVTVNNNNNICGIFNRTNGTGVVIEYKYNGAIVGTISTNGSSVAYNTGPSDYRLKENIAPMTGALDKVTQLKPVTYKWKSDGSNGQGFIAHELQQVIPEAVNGEKDAVDKNGDPEYQSVFPAPVQMIAILVASIQELKATIDAQAARIEALENK